MNREFNWFDLISPNRFHLKGQERRKRQVFKVQFGYIKNEDSTNQFWIQNHVGGTTELEKNKSKTQIWIKRKQNAWISRKNEIWRWMEGKTANSWYLKVKMMEKFDVCVLKDVWRIKETYLEKFNYRLASNRILRQI